MRIKGLDRKEVSWSVRPLYFLLKRQFGKILTPYTVWAHRPSIVLTVTSMMAALEYSKVLDKKIKSLASIRTAQIVGCPF